jgi:hypothetical protein
MALATVAAVGPVAAEGAVAVRENLGPLLPKVKARLQAAT